ncbi:MAG: precorrin-2 C(20)-methyltransferase [Oscillospiraceae bacterium]|nr:precorrin-2 C(20)-methyltransferase [Oscillospiraceae bacterium]
MQNVPELAHKTLLPLCSPMSGAIQTAEHRRSARAIEAHLEKGESVVYLTLGDPTIYSTFSYLQHLLEADGYTVEIVSGVPSFCAAAARLHLPLAQWDEQLHILPALHITQAELAYPGNCVLMKSASHMKDVKSLLRRSGRTVRAVEHCSCPEEKVYYDLEEIPDDAGYFSLVIAREPEE